MTVLSWLVESSVRLTLLVGVVAAALWALRVKSAETQLRVWSGVIVASCLLPWLPDQWIVPVTFGIAEPAATSTLIAPSGVSPASGDAAGNGWLLRLDTLTTMLVAYFAGAAALLARLVVGLSWARRLSAEAIPVSGHLFFESQAVHVPVTAGLLHPRIVVPGTWREWPEDMLAAVRAHEGAHAARRDGLWLTVALLHRAVQWFNPLSWWLARHMASLSERASDDAALTEGVTPARYAEILLSFATAVATRHRRVAWVVAMASASGRDTERRLDRVLTWKGRPEMTRARIVVLALLLISGSAAVYTAGVGASAEGAPAALVEAQLTKTSPVIIRRVEPKYTPRAMRAKIQGIVEIEVDIAATGIVTEARILKSLDATFGLDSEALNSARQWLFRPATVDGKAVPFTATIQMQFRQHDGAKAKQRAEPKAEPKAEVTATPKASETAEQKSAPVVVAPVVLKRVDPKYTPAAMRAKIQGQITLLVVVDKTGAVKSATVAESIDAEHGLDANAIEAAMQWTFHPGTVDGVPQPFTIKVSMEFRLH